MADRVKIGSGAPIYSERKYRQFVVWGVRIPDDMPAYMPIPGNAPANNESLRLYIDAETSIVVADIKAYERSLNLKEEA